MPDDRHEAMRELTRARDAARVDLTRKRQKMFSMLLRLGCHYAGIKTWGARHRSWLANLKLEHREQRFAPRNCCRPSGRPASASGESSSIAFADWSLASIVPALMAMHGIDLVSAVTILSEIDDLSRFASPRRADGYLGGWCHSSATDSGFPRPGKSCKLGASKRTSRSRLKIGLGSGGW